MNRRRFIGAFVAGLSTLAGCVGRGEQADPSPTDADPPGGTPTDSPAPSGTPTRTPHGGGTPTTTPGPGAELENGSFEDGLRGWTIGRDLPDDPDNPDRKVGSEADVTAHLASHGNQSIEFFLDGSADDGTVWVAQEVDLSGVGTLAVDGYSETNSFNTVAQVAVYTGPVPKNGLAEAEFNREHATEDHEGWKTYEYKINHDGPGLVAVGINVVWETGVRRQLDDIRLLAE